MDEHGVDRSADDRRDDPDSPESAEFEHDEARDEPRSYDPFDEIGRPVSPAWDSWSDPPSTFPSASIRRPEPAGQPDDHDSPQADPDEDDLDATQQWLAFTDEGEPSLTEPQQDEPSPSDDLTVVVEPDRGGPADDPHAELPEVHIGDESPGDGRDDVRSPFVRAPIGADDSADDPSDDGDSDLDAPDAETPSNDTPGDDWNGSHDGWLPADSDSDTDDELTQPVAMPQVHEGLMIAERFRLEEQLATRSSFLTWRAFDVKLSRPVLVHLLSKYDPRTSAVLEAAREAATATDSAFLRVLDASTANDDIAYVVCEYVVGKSLETLLAEGPLSGLEAAWVMREVARAMAPMHAKGLFHLRLNPDTIIISSTGNVRLVGFLIDAALTPEPGDVAPKHALQEADVHALGQLLYAMLVSRWPVMPDEHSDPGQRHFGLAPAPMDADGWLTPRQVRAGVSPALDQLCDEVLHASPRLGGQPLETAAAIDEALERVLGTADASSDLSQRVRHSVRPLDRTDSVRSQPADDAAPDLSLPGDAASPTSPIDRPAAVGATPEQPRPRPPHHRTWLRALLLLIALVLVGSLIAVRVRNGRDKASDEPTPSTSQGTVEHPIAKVDDFDPTGDQGNGNENPNQVALAWDKKPNTAWTTVTYLNNAKMGGLKPGVGLVVDLGQVVEVGTVKLTLQGSSTAVSVRVPKGDASKVTAPPMKSEKDWTAVASSAKANTSATFDLKSPTRTRYLLVYLTSLPNVGGNKYRGAIAEIEVTS